MNNKVLVITGMHRSGTSLITQWLNKCGLHVGEQFVGAGIGNTDGHFEDLDFFSCHRHILRDLALPDDGMFHAPVRNLSEEQRQELENLVQQKEQAREQWGWKDPRTCLFLNAYKELLPDAYYIVILRDYNEVVSSLISRMYNRTVHKYATRGGLPAFIWEHFKKKGRKRKLLKRYSQHFLRVWITYNREILRHLEDLPQGRALVVDHTTLADNNMQVFNHLTRQWHFNLDYFNFGQVYKKQLLSNVMDITPYVRDKPLLSEARELQLSLLRFAV